MRYVLVKDLIWTYVCATIGCLGVVAFGWKAADPAIEYWSGCTVFLLLTLVFDVRRR